MKDGYARERSAGYTNTRRSIRRASERPDRWALWALFLALFILIVAAANAHADSSGGAAPPGGGATPTSGIAPSGSPRFGTRVLRRGMQGGDVRVLNGIVRSKSYGARVPLSTVFQGPTENAVQLFQSQSGLRTSGVVDHATAGRLVRSMPTAGATWYGPGFYGSQTACGVTLQRGTIGVANKRLPCGTKVTFAYHGSYVVAPVIDRGPYNPGYSFDLTNGARQALGFDGAGRVRYAVARR